MLHLTQQSIHDFLSCGEDIRCSHAILTTLLICGENLQSVEGTRQFASLRLLFFLLPPPRLCKIGLGWRPRSGLRVPWCNLGIYCSSKFICSCVDGFAVGVSVSAHRQLKERDGAQGASYLLQCWTPTPS
jgi:hypothetical protein